MSIMRENLEEQINNNIQKIKKSTEELKHIAMLRNRLPEIKQDGLAVTRFLSPSVILEKYSDGSVDETFFADTDAVIKHPLDFLLEQLNAKELNIQFDQNIIPDAIVIFGNNDLQQVMHVAYIYEQLAKINQAPKKIYISGKGGYDPIPVNSGHGTTPGIVFTHTEAASMADYLVKLGVPRDVIVEEPKATNSGANAINVSALMREYDKECNQGQVSFKHILVSGTPNGILRQLRTFEKQADYRWQMLSTLPPTTEQLARRYYQEKYSQSDSLLNFICSLRELSNFLKYASTTNFVADRKIKDQQGLLNSIDILIKYYNLLTSENVNANEFYGKFNLCMQYKNDVNNKEEFEKVKSQFLNILNPIFKLFSDHFSLICEKRWMTYLPTDISLKDQTDLLCKQERWIPGRPIGLKQTVRLSYASQLFGKNPVQDVSSPSQMETHSNTKTLN